MTHLEILADKLDERAQEAHRLLSYYVGLRRASLVNYYGGKSSALHEAADLLRSEALDREPIDKEVSE